MDPRNDNARGRTARLLAGAVIAGAVLAGATSPANAAVTGTFGSGILTVSGDNLDNTIEVSRDAAGKITVNGGAVSVKGTAPTVFNTGLIRVEGRSGNDAITINENNGALPMVKLFGAAGNDVLVGGSGNDALFGEAGNDTLLGKGGRDQLFGGNDTDSLTGGDADDQAFGQAGNDRMIWNPGDDTDLNEGAAGIDTTEVNGGNGGEQFTTTTAANGTRVRFDRLDPAPFTLDIGTTEGLVVNANGGDDRHAATGNLNGLIKVTIDGGAQNDTLLGTNGADVLLGGNGNDFLDGQQGNDVALLGADDDTFQWDPGDGSDTVEGQDGVDGMLFNGSNAEETMAASANGGRVLFTRDVANITMDLNDVEAINVKALGGADNLAVSDLSPTDVVEVNVDLAALGVVDGADNVVVGATNGADVAIIAGEAGSAQVFGLSAVVSVTGATPGVDRLTVNGLGGDDVLEASRVKADSMLLTLDGGAGDDAVIGGDGDDFLRGGDGNDVLLGGPGIDTIDGGPGEDIGMDLVGGDRVRSAAPADKKSLAQHARVAKRLANAARLRSRFVS